MEVGVVAISSSWMAEGTPLGTPSLPPDANKGLSKEELFLKRDATMRRRLATAKKAHNCLKLKLCSSTLARKHLMKTKFERFVILFVRSMSDAIVKGLKEGEGEEGGIEERYKANISPKTLSHFIHCRLFM